MELCNVADLPNPLSPSAVSNAHHRLSEGLIGTLSDLDELLRAGDPQAGAALLRVRRHLSSRAARDLQSTMVSPSSMAGRESRRLYLACGERARARQGVRAAAGFHSRHSSRETRLRRALIAALAQELPPRDLSLRLVHDLLRAPADRDALLKMVTVHGV